MDEFKNIVVAPTLNVFLIFIETPRNLQLRKTENSFFTIPFWTMIFLQNDFLNELQWFFTKHYDSWNIYAIGKKSKLLFKIYTKIQNRVSVKECLSFNGIL